MAAKKTAKKTATKKPAKPAARKTAKAAMKKTAKPAAKKTVRKTATKAKSKAAVRPKVGEDAASTLIDRRISELGDWRGDTLEKVRRVILKADTGIVEEWKWENPVWSHQGLICTGETYKKVVKLTFAKGAFLKDPSRLFNSSLEGNVRRAIDIHETDDIDEGALTALVRAAVALNLSRKT